MEDDGTNSFLAFLTAAQEDKNAPKAVEKFNDDANLLAQLTNDRGEPNVPPPLHFVTSHLRRVLRSEARRINVVPIAGRDRHRRPS